MDYIRTAMPELIDLRGPAEARHLAGTSAALIGMQFVDACKQDLAIPGSDASSFVELFVRMGEAQRDEVAARQVDDGKFVVRQRGWRLMRGIAPLHEVAFEVWNALWEGCLAAHDRRLRWQVLARQDRGDEAFEWLIAPKSAGTADR